MSEILDLELCAFGAGEDYKRSLTELRDNAEEPRHPCW